MSIIITSNHTRVRDWVKNCRGEINHYSSILYTTLPLIALQGYHKTTVFALVLGSGGIHTAL